MNFGIHIVGIYLLEDCLMIGRLIEWLNAEDFGSLPTNKGSRRFNLLEGGREQNFHNQVCLLQAHRPISGDGMVLEVHPEIKCPLQGDLLHLAG